MPRMTRARTASYGVVTPPPLDRWIEAVLMLFVSLAHSVAATFGMRRWIRRRDWHTPSEPSALPQTKRDIQKKATRQQQRSFSGKRSASRESRLHTPRGQTVSPLETLNRDSRGKPENDTVHVPAHVPADVLAVVAVGVAPAVVPGVAPQRDGLEARASGSRLRASGTTPSMCVQISPL